MAEEEWKWNRSGIGMEWKQNGMEIGWNGSGMVEVEWNGSGARSNLEGEVEWRWRWEWNGMEWNGMASVLTNSDIICAAYGVCV